MTSRGAFIVLEGIDHCGKTTQCKLLHDHFLSTGAKVICLRFPNRETPIGGVINEYLAKGVKLDSRAIHLLFSANRWEARDTILQYLKDGVNIICDRYAYSGAAFSSTNGLDLDWCKKTDAGLPQPDAVIYLDLSVEKACKRSGFGDELYEKDHIQRSVKSVYEDRLWNDEYWYRVSAEDDVESVQKKLQTLCSAIITSVSERGEEPKLLWSDN